MALTATTLIKLGKLDESGKKKTTIIKNGATIEQSLFTKEQLKRLIEVGSAISDKPLEEE